MKNFPTKTLTSRRDKKKPRAINLGQHPGPRGQARGQRGVSTSKGGEGKTQAPGYQLPSLSGPGSLQAHSRFSVLRAGVFVPPTHSSLEERSTQIPGPTVCLSCRVQSALLSGNRLRQVHLKRFHMMREDYKNWWLVGTLTEAGCLVGTMVAHTHPILCKFLRRQQ